MAVRMLMSNANLSGSAGSWLRAEAYQLDVYTSSTSYTDDTNTVRTQAVTYANACNAVGVYFGYRKGSAASVGTLTVKLQEYSGGTWVDRATCSINIATDLKGGAGLYFAAHTPYAVDTAASKWRYQFQCSTATNRLHLLRTTTAGQYLYAAIGDLDSAAPSDGDIALMKQGVTVTINSSRSFGASGNTSFAIGDDCTVQWENPPSSAYTLTLAGGMITSAAYNFLIGSEANLISAAQRATISFSSAYAIRGLDDRYLGPSDAVYSNVSMFGDGGTSMSSRIRQRAESGQATVYTEDDMSGVWQVGDTVYPVGREYASNNDGTTYTIQGISGTLITLNTNLLYAIPPDSALVNYSRINTYGIEWSSGSAWWDGSATVCKDVCNVNGVLFSNCAPRATLCGVTNVESNFKRCFVRNVGAYHIGTLFGYITRPAKINLDSVHFFASTVSYGSLGVMVNNSSIKNCTSKGIYTGATGTNNLMLGNDCDMENVVITGPSMYTFSLAGSKWTITDCEFFGQYSTALSVALHIGGVANTVMDCAIDQYQTQLGRIMQMSSTWGTRFDNCRIGVHSAGLSGFIYVFTDMLVNAVFESCEFGAPFAVDNMTNAINGSMLRFRNFNKTVGDHRAWTRQGRFQSDSGKLLAINELATEALYCDYAVTTNTIIGATVGISVYAQIANAAFYAGSHQLPKLGVTYDGTSTIEDTADANTDRQMLLVTFSPTTNNGTITARLSCKTNATGADREVRFDTLTFNVRQYGKTFAAVVKSITEIVDIPLGEIASLTSNGFITQGNEATVAAYTGIGIDHANALITLADDHTINELYDYCQYHLAQTANLDKAEMLTTIDGTNFNLTYDLVVDGCTLSGAGKWLKMPTKTLTKLNGGVCSMKLTDSSGTIANITVNNIVPGSRLRLYDFSDVVELLNTVVNASSYTYPFMYNGVDHDIRVRLMYCSGTSAKEWFETQGVATSDGLTIRAEQVDDDVYNAVNIDGSTVTECSVDGQVIRIYVDDPDNVTTFQRIYNWYRYLLSTELGIRHQDGDYIEATDATHYTLKSGMKLVNQDIANPLNILGANIVPASGNATDVFDLSNGASIALNFNRVEGFPYSTGGGSNPLDETIEGGMSMRELLRVMRSALAGRSTGAGTSREAFLSADGAKERIVATIDESGNRTAIALDGAE